MQSEFEESTHTDSLVRLALLARGFEYTDDETHDDCEYCKAGTCVQRMEYLGEDGCVIVHGCQDELN